MPANPADDSLPQIIGDNQFYTDSFDWSERVIRPQARTFFENKKPLTVPGPIGEEDANIDNQTNDLTGQLRGPRVLTPEIKDYNEEAVRRWDDRFGRPISYDSLQEKWDTLNPTGVQNINLKNYTSDLFSNTATMPKYNYYNSDGEGLDPDTTLQYDNMSDAEFRRMAPPNLERDARDGKDNHYSPGDPSLDPRKKPAFNQEMMRLGGPREIELTSNYEEPTVDAKPSAPEGYGDHQATAEYIPQGYGDDVATNDEVFQQKTVPEGYGDHNLTKDETAGGIAENLVKGVAGAYKVQQDLQEKFVNKPLREAFNDMEMALYSDNEDQKILGITDFVKKLLTTGLTRAATSGGGKFKTLGEGPELGNFGGRMTTNPARQQSMNKAESMLEGGVDPYKVLAETGAYRGLDGQMKYIINPKNAQFVRDPLPMQDHSFVGRLADYLDFPELYKDFPAVAETKLHIKYNGHGPYHAISGSFSPATNTISGVASTFSDIKSLIIHEIQHKLQEINKFAKGGSPTQFAPTPSQMEDVLLGNQAIPGTLLEELKTALPVSRISQKQPADFLNASDIHDYFTSMYHTDQGMFNRYVSLLSRNIGHLRYHRIAGEVEARDAAAMLEMTNKEIGKELPNVRQHLDVPFNQQDFFFHNPGDARAVDKTPDGTLNTIMDELVDRLERAAKGKEHTVNMRPVQMQIEKLQDHVARLESAGASIEEIQMAKRAVSESQAEAFKKITADNDQSKVTSVTHISQWLKDAGAEIVEVKTSGKGSRKTSYIVFRDPENPSMPVGRVRVPDKVNKDTGLGHIGYDKESYQGGRMVDTGSYVAFDKFDKGETLSNYKDFKDFQEKDPVGFARYIDQKRTHAENVSGGGFSKWENLIDALKWRLSRSPDGNFLIEPGKEPRPRYHAIQADNTGNVISKDPNQLELPLMEQQQIQQQQAGPRDTNKAAKTQRAKDRSSELEFLSQDMKDQGYPMTAQHMLNLPASKIPDRQIKVMQALEDGAKNGTPVMGMTELEKAMDIGKSSSLSAVMASMEKNGFIERDPNSYAWKLKTDTIEQQSQQQQARGSARGTTSELDAKILDLYRNGTSYRDIVDIVNKGRSGADPVSYNLVERRIQEYNSLQDRLASELGIEQPKRQLAQRERDAGLDTPKKGVNAVFFKEAEKMVADATKWRDLKEVVLKGGLTDKALKTLFRRNKMFKDYIERDPKYNKD